jgi:hypothetical protein
LDPRRNLIEARLDQCNQVAKRSVEKAGVLLDCLIAARHVAADPGESLEPRVVDQERRFMKIACGDSQSLGSLLQHGRAKQLRCPLSRVVEQEMAVNLSGQPPRCPGANVAPSSQRVVLE